MASTRVAGPAGPAVAAQVAPAVPAAVPATVQPTWPHIGITGHRDLTTNTTRWVRTQLDRVLRKLHNDHDAEVLLCGMALGADLAAAETAATIGLHLWAYLPFTDQTSGWPPQQTRRHTRLVDQADRVLLPDGHNLSAGRRARIALLHQRNRMIVADADLMIAVWDRRRSTGGTATTAAHALDTGKPLVTIDPAANTVTITGHPAGI